MASFVSGAADGVSNSTTPVTVVASPAGATQRMAKSLIINNLDTVAATVSVNYVDASNTRVIAKVTLQPGDQLQFNENDLLVLDATNKSITIVLAGAITSNQLAWCVAWADQS